MRNSRPGGKSSTVSEYPEAIDRLTETLNGLPGIGKRNAERLAMALFGWNQDRLADFAEQAASLHERVFTCEACGHLADGERCRYCLDPTRDPAVIAVVEDAKQVIAIEKSHMFRGLYHVLGGKFSPLDGVEIEDLNVESLYERLDQGKVREVILATSPDVDGEATASYLASLLAERFPQLSLSRIAPGLPVGSDLSYADSATMASALSSRRTFET